MPSEKPGYYLVQDRWNDHGYQTQYHLSVVAKKSETYVGAVKILKRGQTDSDEIQITEDFSKLSKEFVSIGESLDYYERLAELKADERNVILTSLRDAVRLPELQENFGREDGWTTSLFREQKTDQVREYLALAKALVENDFTSVPGSDFSFSFLPGGWREPLEFDFTGVAVDDEPVGFFPHSWELPGRIIAIIGTNASGKSTLLARIARVGFGTVASREEGEFDALGSIDPTGIGFPRIVAVSYSAFDSFKLPGIKPRGDAPDEREQIIKDSRAGEGRFVFCGLRDIASELQELIEQESDDGEFQHDRVTRTLLKSIDELAQDFGRTVELCRKRGQWTVFQDALEILVADPSFSELENTGALEDLLKHDPVKTFHAWSTGHKVCLQIIASLCAYLTPRSLLLFDEPEMHLHPPLLAALMHAIRRILKQRRAFGVVATHSPVVIQETLARHVIVVRREGNVADWYRAPVETFGENVGNLTNQVFGLNSEVSNFYSVLDKLIDRLGELDAIEALFEPYGLSHQARAYVMSQLNKTEG